MLQQAAFQRLLSVWKNDCGISLHGRMWIPIEGRVEAYKDLIKTLTELHNYTLEDLDNCWSKIQDFSIPASRKGDLKAKWQNDTLNDWNLAVASYFPDGYTILTHDNTNDVVPGSKHRVGKAPVEYVPPPPEVESNPPPVPDDMSPEDMFRITGIPAPDSEPDLEFLAILRGDK